jgi:hypothetical protein
MASHRSTKGIPAPIGDPPDGSEPEPKPDPAQDPQLPEAPAIAEPPNEEFAGDDFIPPADIPKPEPNITELSKGDSELDKKVLTTEPDSGNDDDRVCVGEMVIRLYGPDMIFDVEFHKLGLIGPGRFEQAMPFFLQRIMQATAAADREAQGLPPMRFHE